MESAAVPSAQGFSCSGTKNINGSDGYREENIKATYNSRRVVNTLVGTRRAVITPSTSALLASSGIHSGADGCGVGASEQESCGGEEGEELHFEV